MPIPLLVYGIILGVTAIVTSCSDDDDSGDSGEEVDDWSGRQVSDRSDNHP